MEIGQLVVKLLIQNNRHILLLQLGYLKTPEVSQGLNAYIRLHTTVCESQFYIWAMIIEDKFELLNVAVDTQCNCGETDCQ